MKTKLFRLIVGILVVIAAALIVYSEIENQIPYLVLLFIAYIVSTRLFFTGKTQNEYSEKFIKIYRIIMIPLLALMVSTLIFINAIEDKQMAFTIFIVMLGLTIIGFSLPIFYRMLKNRKEPAE